MTGVAKFSGASWLALLFTSTCAFAQEPARDLKTQADMLRQWAENVQNAGLVPQPGVLASMPTPVSEPPAPDQTPDPTGSNQWLKSIKLTGFVDLGYTKNLNNPGNFPASVGGFPGPAPFPPNTQNNTRLFDTQGNSFLFNMGEIMLEKVATSDSVAGIRLKLGVGKDAGLLSATEGLGVSPQFDLVEGYAEFLMPIGTGLDFKIGKMATLAGYEVIESKDNWDYSRSLLFSWAIPLTHTGIRFGYTFIDSILTGTLGLMNGWNTIADNNNGKTLEFQISATPLPWLAALVNFYTGEEMQGSLGTGTGKHRFVFDGDITVTWGYWKFGWNGDYGADEALAAGTVREAWEGNALYVKYQATHWYAPSIRAEYFNDMTGGVTGFAVAEGVGGAAPAGYMRLWEFTVENEFKINDNLLFRIEYRHDEANQKIFLQGINPAGRRFQDTIAFETIFQF